MPKQSPAAEAFAARKALVRRLGLPGCSQAEAVAQLSADLAAEPNRQNSVLSGAARDLLGRMGLAFRGCHGTPGKKSPRADRRLE
jgi:hypothetical protein